MQILQINTSIEVRLLGEIELLGYQYYSINLWYASLAESRFADVPVSLYTAVEMRTGVFYCLNRSDKTPVLIQS